MLAALDAASFGVGAGAGFVVGLVVALALGRRGYPWRLDWRLTVARGGAERALYGRESDEPPSGGMATASGDQGEQGEP